MSRIARQQVWLTSSAAPSPGAVEHVVERPLRGVREVDRAAEGEQPVDELHPEPAEPAGARLARAVRERVPPRPRQPDHPHPERPECVDQLRVTAERLGALDREHQPESAPRSRRSSRSGRGVDLEDVVAFSRTAAWNAPASASADAQRAVRARGRPRRRSGTPAAGRRPRGADGSQCSAERVRPPPLRAARRARAAGRRGRRQSRGKWTRNTMLAHEGVEITGRCPAPIGC